MNSQWEFENAVRGNRACNYSAMVVLTFTVCEWFFSAEEEAHQIWKRPWTRLKSHYVFLRVLSFGTQLFSIVPSLYPTTSAISSTPPPNCRIIVGVQGVASQVIVMGVQAILLMRVEALYHKYTKLKLLLRLIYLIELVAMSVIFGLSEPKIKYGVNCVITYFPPMPSAAFLLIPIVVELILFILTMLKFYVSLRDGWGREPIIFRFLRDGIWAFALPFALLIINVLFIALLPGPLTSIGYSWVIAIPAFAGCRLILNMSHLLRSRRPEDLLTYPEQDFMIDTVDTELIWSHGTVATSGSNGA